MTATAVSEVETLERKLADAKKRAASKTLAERLRGARGRRDSSAHLANRAATIVQKLEVEITAHAEASKTRRAMGFPPPPPLRRIQIFSTDDVRQGKQEATAQMTPQEFLNDARAQISRLQSESEAASREVSALETELARHPVWKKYLAAFGKLREEFLLAAESGDALTDESVRKKLQDIAGRESDLENRSRGELMEAGLPDIRAKLSIEVWNFIPSESLRRDIENFIEQRGAAVKRLKQTN